MKRNIKLATTTSISTTYAGEFGNQYIAASLLSASTINDGGITVKPNINFRETIKKVNTGSLVQDASCDFNPTSNITLTERVLEPDNLQVNLQVCKNDFLKDWEAQSMGFSGFKNLPPQFSDFILAHVAAEIAQKTEQTIWRGVAANAGEYAGLVTLAAADADIPAAQKIAAGAVTSANVIAEMGKVVDEIPSALYGKEDLHLYVSQNVARAYVRQLGGFGANGLGAAGTNSMGTQWWNNGSLSFDGVKVFVAQGMNDNSMMAAERSNLYFGTSLVGNMNEVKLLDMSDLDGSSNCRIICRFSGAVNYGIASDIVVYS
tara:strand:- start:5448 stop:6401 length:954 start_codon:yes stop_codon:yes gene_type:complete